MPLTIVCSHTVHSLISMDASCPLCWYSSWFPHQFCGGVNISWQHTVRATLRWSHSRLEVLLKGLSRRGYRLTGALMQQLSSVYKDQWLGTWDRTLPDAAVTLRDQAEGHLLHQINYIAARTNLPERSLSKGAKGVSGIGIGRMI